MKKAILDLIKILNDEKLTKLSYAKEEKDSKIKISIERQNQTTLPQQNIKVNTNLDDEENKTEEIKGTKIIAPIVGTFYEAPGVGKKPFVKIGDTVKKGQILFILEAMKVMNEIKAPHQGKVVAIYVKNEQLVEYDQTIMIIE